MMHFIVALALGQSLNLNNTPVRQGRGFDGGVNWGVYCTNCTGGTGGSGGGWVPDGGSIGTVTVQNQDVFQAVVGSSRYNQVEVSYATTDPDSITSITVTKTNGGDATNTAGQAVYSTGTNTTGAIKAVTNATTTYRPHAETYAAFSAIFTTGTTGATQRVGIYDANNGFFLGFNGTTFGITIRKGGVDTTTARASFNLDTLQAVAGSKYTRAGVPETMDPTKDQLYRIRYGWLGAAPVTFEILSPDGAWVPFHIYRHPNSVAATSINVPDLPITLEAVKTSGATNVTISTACWAAGSTSDLATITTSISASTLASLNRSVITGETTAGGGAFVNVKVTPAGALTTEVNQATFPWLVAGADGGTLRVDEGVGPDGGVWSVYVVNPGGTGGGGTVDQGVGQDGGAWNVSINNFPATQPVSGTVTSNQGAAAATAGRWPVQLTDGTDLSLVTAAGALVVDGSGVTQPISGTVTANAGTGNFTVVQSTAANLNATVTGTVTANAGTGTFTVGGTAASDQPISGNPVLVGVEAESDAAALATVSAEGDVTELKATLEGRLLVQDHHPLRFHANSGLSTATTLTQIQAAPGAGVSLYITDFVLSASVASTTTTDQQLTLKYGTGTNCGTGTTYITACFNQANGGCAVNLRTPIKLPANNALCWMHAAAGSKVMSVMGYTAP